MENRLEEIDKSEWNEKWIKRDVLEILWWVSDALLSALSIIGQEIIVMVEDYWWNNEMIKNTEAMVKEKVELDMKIQKYRKKDKEVDKRDYHSYLIDSAEKRHKNLESKKTEFHEAIKRTKSALKSLKDSLINKNAVLNEN